MSNAVMSKSKNLVLKGFEKTILKSVKVIEKEGKRPLVFVVLMDGDSYEDTPDLIFVKQDLGINDVANLKSLEKKLVTATIATNEFGGKKNFVCIDIQSATN